jgi:hypothetical protein
MSNLLKFPGRSRPIPRPVDVDELTLLELEIELARAKLANVRSATRQANAIWFSYCVRKIAFWAVVLWALSALLK